MHFADQSVPVKADTFCYLLLIIYRKHFICNVSMKKKMSICNMMGNF